MFGFKKDKRKIDFDQQKQLAKSQSEESGAEKLSDDSNRDKKVDIKRYQDAEGLTVQKMEFGLWLVEHRKQLLMIPKIFLILFSAVTLIYSIYGFAYYISWGMKEDQILANELVKQNLVGHEYFIARSAQNLQYGKLQIIDLGKKKYDFLVQVSNPNQKHSAEFIYYFKEKNEEFHRSSNFILPGEKKYILALGQEFTRSPTGVVFYTDNITWQRINLHKYPDWEKFRGEHLNIGISDIKFTPAKATILTEKLNLNSLQFVAVNNTAYNYWEVDLVILLFRQSKVIAVNKYVLNNFMSGQTREIEVTWPGRLGRVDNTVITPEINITRDDIYIKFEGGTGEEK